MPCAPPVRPTLSRPPLRKEPCNHGSDTTWFWVLREVVPVLTRRDGIANAPAGLRAGLCLLPEPILQLFPGMVPFPLLLSAFDWWLFVPDYNGQQCPSVFHSPCHFSVPFPKLLDCSKKHAQWDLELGQQAKPIPAFWW